MMQTSWRFSWLLAVILIMHQSLILHHSTIETRNLPNSISSKTTVLPLDSTYCTLSKQNNRNTVNILDRTTNPAGHALFSLRGILPSYFVSSAPSRAPLSFHKTTPHLRV